MALKNIILKLREQMRRHPQAFPEVKLSRDETTELLEHLSIQDRIRQILIDCELHFKRFQSPDGDALIVRIDGCLMRQPRVPRGNDIALKPGGRPKTV